MIEDDTQPVWRALNDAIIGSGKPFGLLGILNLTPDSFYDGGKYEKPELALEHAESMFASGTDVLDLGAESSRPGSRPVGVDIEIARLEPVLEALSVAHAPERISVDTWHGRTACHVLARGAGIINDVSACLWDPELLEVLVQFRPGYVLMHNRGLPETMQVKPHYDDVLKEICYFFEKRLNALTAAGFPEDHIALDPGLGFGKTAAHNMAILRNLEIFRSFGRPLLIGLSMKSFFRDFFSVPLARRDSITAVASVLAWQKGVYWHRVHNPKMVSCSIGLAWRMDPQKP